MASQKIAQNDVENMENDHKKQVCYDFEGVMILGREALNFGENCNPLSSKQKGLACRLHDVRCSDFKIWFANP